MPARKLLLISLFLLLFMGGSTAWAQRYGKPVVRQNPNLLKQQAFEEYIAGEFESSADLYKQALDAGIKEYGQNSDFVFDLYYELGTMSLEEGNFTRAARYLPKAVNLKPNSVLARVKLSDLYLMQGRINEAFGQVQQAQRRNPKSILAQKQLVKLMMERAKKNNKRSDAANLACTMESFKLTTLSTNLVQGTHNLISQWQKRINGSGKYAPPRVNVAMATTRVSAPPKPKVAPVRIKPPQKKKTVKPVKKVKPKSKPVKKTRPKPARKTVKKVAKSKPKRKPDTSKKARARRAKRMKAKTGLVPPPPPILPPVYSPPAADIKLETKAKVKKAKPKKKKRVKKRKRRTVPDEPDFILDWASKKKKSK